MYTPLHHKYRPQTFAELVGQDAIATTLTNAITSQRFAPAYLLTGPRGTGKTSSARIFAKSLNCLNQRQPTPNPCGQCASCQAIISGSSLDVIEIDAASNSGVDQVRDLIEKCQFAPIQGRWKVYTIDEVHAVTGAAAQALLKTLEEPPIHVIFILCTTEPQRLPNTILSRCQHFNFRRICMDAMVNHLRAIATAEKISITDEAISLVAQIAKGGLRDAQTLLDLLSLLEGCITPHQVWELVGTVPEAELLGLIQAITTDEPQTVLKSVRNLLDQGKEPLVILENLTEFYTNLLIAKTSPNSQELLTVTDGIWEKLKEVAEALEVITILTGQQHLRTCEVQVKLSRQPQLWLEVALLGLLPSNQVTSPLPTLTQTNLDSLPSSAETIWQQVVNLQPPAIKALLKQHAQLVFFNGTNAQIKVGSSPLKQRVEQALPSLSVAFQSCTKQLVEVTLC